MTHPNNVNSSLLDEFTTIVSQAAATVLAARARGLAPRQKADLTPVSAADHASEAVIIESVSRLLPGVPIVSEEAAAGGESRGRGGTFVLVDPVDGTRELLAGRDEFTVNIALIAGSRPRLGVIAAPALGVIWRADELHGAERLQLAPGLPARSARAHTALRPRTLPRQGLIVALSRSHLDTQTDALVARLGPVERLVAGSSLKFCRVAEGAADLYPRLAPTQEWDVAAGDAILSIAGGAVTTPAGDPLLYGTSAERTIPAFIAWADRDGKTRLKL